jgi:hypothetical protein
MGLGREPAVFNDGLFTAAVYQSGMGSMVRWIATTTLLGLLAQPATAQTPTVINLSCDGTSQIMGSPSASREPVTKVGLVVNLVDRTVTGLGAVARIDRADAASVSFTGQGPLVVGGSRTGTLSLSGELDRVTGALSAMASTVSAFDNKVVGTLNYELVCKVTNRLF